MQIQNVTVQRMYKRMPFPDACELHERLMQGKADEQTRSLLKAALRGTQMGRRTGTK